jgi:thiol-disulfide isomerase/thioredoxin
MKLFITALLIFFITSSYGKQFNQVKDSIEFVVEGKVHGLNGETIALVIPSYIIKNKITTVVKNDRFEFKGKILDKDVFADIMLDKDITDPTGIYDSFGFILSEGKTVLEFKAIKNSNVHRYLFDSLKVLEGQSGIEYYKYRKLIRKEILGGITYKRDSIYIDSLFKFVFPQRRQRFESMFNKLKDSIGCYYVKLKILAELSKSFIYNEDKSLGIEGKQYLINQFKELAPYLLTHTEYQYYQNYFLLQLKKDKIVFKDFELESIDNSKIKLSDIIKKNRYTVLYFWWSSCAPCRAFNKSNSQDYSLLRSKSVEIVSINTDVTKVQWKNASKSDKFKWKNLYAGSLSQMLTHYQVEAFPTKIVINNKFEIVDVKFSSLKDLINIF